MRRKRNATTFNLSFLDVMSCGFGAVVLIFLIVEHSSSTQSNAANTMELAEVNMLERDIELEERLSAEARNALRLVDLDIVEVSGASKRLVDELENLKEELAEEDSDSLARLEHVNQLKTEIKNLEKEIERLRSSDEVGQGRRSRFVRGEGERQYLTGLRVGGRRIMVLLDTSSSMLDRTVVNILRLRNLSDARKRQAKKWQSVVGTMDWLTAQFPQSSQFQIYSFNTEAKPVIADTDGEWLSVSDTDMLEEAMAEVRRLVPDGGTSLANAFEAVEGFVSLPDNIILITDGLPTQDSSPGSGKVNSEKRMRFFSKALKHLPGGIPINVILSPMEGDPAAAAAFWNLAVVTGGSFLSPSKDWP
ncbi:MAG: VWA domain-containing protein [Pseudomonadales bacterium]